MQGVKQSVPVSVCRYHCWSYYLYLHLNGADVSRGGEAEGEGDSDLQLEEGKAGDGKSDDDDDDDDEVEYMYGDEDMLFDPVPPERLHKNDSIKEPMGEFGGRNWGEGEQKLEF